MGVQIINSVDYMEASQQNLFAKVIKTAIFNLASQEHLLSLKKKILQIKSESDIQQQNMTKKDGDVSQKQLKKKEQIVTVRETVEKKNYEEIGIAKIQQTTDRNQSEAIIEKQNRQTAIQQSHKQENKKQEVSHQVIEESIQKKLNEPPALVNKSKNLEESTGKQKSIKRELSFQSRNGQRKSSEEQSINLEFTLKTRNSKNLSNTQGRVDSLMYSDATLMYSNATGFGVQIQTEKIQRERERVQSLKQKLNNIQDGEQGDISARMQRAQSRQYDRMRTQSQNPSDQDIIGLNKLNVEEGSIFKTQVSEYKNKISKIRELKQNKKKKLQQQLSKLNRQLEELQKKQAAQHQMAVKPNNFQSRVKISDNIDAKVKAQKLVKVLRHQKKTRHEGKLGDLQQIDKNINHYMEELMKQRYKNQERIKQKKKLQIIERMKQQQTRKIQEQERKNKNVQFVNKLRNSQSNNHLHKNVIPITQNNQQYNSQNYKPKQVSLSKNSNLAQENYVTKERSPTKKSQPNSQLQATPELSRKKAYLKKIRNLSFKKDKPDAYQQVLM